jgi:Spy/CpxP family protein refolding chaperone
MKNLRSATLIICAVSSMFLGMPALAQEADFSPEMTADDSLTGDGEMDMLLAALPSAESVLAATPGGPVLDVADPAVGAGGPPGGPHMGGFHHGGHHGPFGALQGPLALTSDQYERLYSLKNQSSDANGPKMMQLHQLHRQLKDSLASADLDTKRSSDIASKIVSIKAELDRSRMDRLIACAGVLTSDQRKALHDEMVKHAVMGGMHHHGHGGHGHG